MQNFYRGEWVWVTGASSGIGKELVIQLKALGAKVLLASRNTAELKKIAVEHEFTAGEYAIEALDLENLNKLQIFVDRALKKYGIPKVIIHNGGISQRSYTIDTKLETLQKIMNTNFFGAAEITRILLTKFQRKSSLHIAVVSSVAGKLGSPFRSAYSASKFALVGFFHCLRAEEERNGVYITMVYPGFIQTNISKNALLGDGKQTGKMDSVIAEGLPAQVCAYRIIKAISQKRREVVIAGLKEKFGLFLQTIWPNLFYSLVQEAKVR